VQDSDINEERVGEHEDGSSEDDNVTNASKESDDGQSWTNGAEGGSESTSAMITLVDGNDAQARSGHIDGGEGGLEALVGSLDGIGAISVDLAVETTEDAPEHGKSSHDG
jgi:hypothetical protein